MSRSSELSEFLTSRRARITPDRAGLRTYGDNRRVPGLRREEVALLAGVSVDYYTRLERGNPGGVSDSVLEALARALQLDDPERAHLFDLARASRTSAPRRRRGAKQIRPSVQQMLDAMTGVPAFVRNGRLDILGTNQLGRALYSGHFQSPVDPPNTARFVFFDAAAQAFYVEWERVAKDVVAILRAEAGRDPYDRALSDLVGELSTRSELFRTLWAAHDVGRHDTGVKRFRHPIVGELEVTYESMELVADPGFTMFVYTAEPGGRHPIRRAPMQITKNSLDTAAGPEGWFTGSVYIDAVASPTDEFRVSASSVHFTPGARTAWHTHPHGQTIFVLEGSGLCQRHGGPVEAIHPGDRVFFEPGENHWHGAAATRFMTHIAIVHVDDDGNAATWGEHVSDQDYAAG